MFIKTRKSLVWLLSVVTLCSFLSFNALAQDKKTAPEVSPDKVFRSHGFPRFESARHLCQERVYGSGAEISWDVLTTSVQPDQLAAFYTEHLGVKALTKDVDGWTWRLTSGSPQPDHVLSIHPITAEGPWKQCKQSIPSDAKTIIMLSTMMRFWK